MSVRRVKALCGVVVAVAAGLGSVVAGGEQAGIVVESTASGGAAAVAGLLPGDVLLRWHRAPAPPANPEAAAGTLSSPFDIDEVELEEAPRGPVTLSGLRGGEPITAVVGPGAWRLTTRPSMVGAALETYLEGRAALAEEEAAERLRGVAGWRRLAERLAAAQAHGAASWLWSRIGLAELRLDLPEDGEGSFRRAIEASERLGDRRRIAHLKTALAFQWERRSRLEDVSRLHRESLAIREAVGPRSLGVAANLHQLGSLADDRDELSAADEHYRRALAIRLEQAPGSLAVADTLNNQGILAGKRDDMATAGDLYRQALTIREGLVPESVYTASSLNNLGTVASRSGDLAAAEQHYGRALSIQQKLAPGSLDEASSHSNLGIVAWRQGDMAAAEQRFRRALAIVGKAAPESLAVATNLGYLGALSSSRRDFSTAEDHHRRALAIWQRLAPEGLDVARSFGNLGVLATHRGDLDAAEAHYRRAIEIFEKLAPGGSDTAQTFGNLGTVAAERGDYRTAEQLFRRALTISMQLTPEGLDVALGLANLGKLAILRGDLPAAEEPLRRALAIREAQAPGGLEVSDVLLHLGVVARERGETAAARELFQRSLDIRTSVAPGSASQAEALYEMARLHRQLERPGEALELYRRSLTALESQSRLLGGGDESRSRFLARYGEPYRETIELMIEEGRTAEAFHVLERSSARGLLALLAERDLLFADLPEGLDRARRIANTAYDRALHELAGWTSASEDSDEQKRRLRRQVERAQLRRQEVEAEIRVTAPRLAALDAAAPLTLAAAQSALDPGTLLLAYSIGDAGSHLFAVGNGRGGFAVFPLHTDGETLMRDVERFRRLWLPGERGVEWIRGEAAKLTATLLAPVADRIAAAERLIIVPDGPLHYLPFAALRDPTEHDFRYLVEAKPVSVVASATLWKELRDAPRTSAAVRVAAFADPQYPSSPREDEAREPVLRSLVRDGVDLSPLPGTRAEAAVLGALYGEDARLFVGAEASEETAKTAAPDASILHFACHGLVDDREPLSSALVLSIPEEWSEGQDNGLLQAWEIFEQLRIDAELVTLSACDTALGKEGGGEGLIGLTRAFQFAGARTVLASLWAVADDSTAALMERFYRHLHAGNSKDQALRLAQIELINGPVTAGKGLAKTERVFQHPFYWAAFQLFGDWR